MEMILQTWEFLSAMIGPSAPFFVIGYFGVFLILVSMPILLKKEVDQLARLPSRRGAAAAADGDQPTQLRYANGKGDILDKFSEYLEPQGEEELSAARLKLIQAGYRSSSAVQTMNFAKMMMGVGFLSVGVLYILIQPGEPTVPSLLLTILIPGGVGYMLPSYWVERRLQQRQEDVTNGFPDALDLMLVCVEAGQSLDQAILRVATETKASSPTLAEEFEVVANEMRAGKDRVMVLRDMAERCGVNDISSFVTVLVQSANFGTSISDALRVYADEMRDKRVLRAEEKANVLPTKLTIGTMLFTVPPLLIIMVGPSIYDIYVNLLGGGDF
jgi:tight adherence protein C